MTNGENRIEDQNSRKMANKRKEGRGETRDLEHKLIQLNQHKQQKLRIKPFSALLKSIKFCSQYEIKQ
jgi:hypothetical protein